MLVDSHCHLDRLDLTKYNGHLEGALTAAKENGIEHILCVCIDISNFADIQKIANKHEGISISVGVHPNERAGDEVSVETLTQLALEPEVVAIGETGLDYYRSEGNTAWQHQRFRNHIEVAKAVNKPLIIHTRDAKDDTIAILKEADVSELGGVLHCFTDNWEIAKQALDLNFYISFSGIVTFKNARELQEVAKLIPLDRMLVETDAPYLAPVPYRGKSNEPAYVRYVAEFIAKLRNEPFEKIAEQTTRNFYRLFGELRDLKT